MTEFKKGKLLELRLKEGFHIEAFIPDYSKIHKLFSGDLVVMLAENSDYGTILGEHWWVVYSQRLGITCEISVSQYEDLCD